MNNLWTQTWDVSRSFAPPSNRGASGGAGASAVAPAGPDFTAFNAEVAAIEEEIKKANNDVSDVRNAHKLMSQEARAERLEELKKDAARSSAKAKNRTKKIKEMLEELKLNNEANRMRPGSGPRTAEDRHRTNITVGLAERLRELHQLVLVVEGEIKNESRKKLQRHLFMVTGKPATDEMLDEILEHGQSEDVLKKAVQMQGRDANINEDQLRDAVVDIDAKMDVVLQVTKEMVELQEMFLDMAVMVEAQGEYLNQIEVHVGDANTPPLNSAPLHSAMTPLSSLSPLFPPLCIAYLRAALRAGGGGGAQGQQLFLSLLRAIFVPHFVQVVVEVPKGSFIFVPRFVQVVVEVPKGSFVKRHPDGAIDYVDCVPCPFNYGSVPSILALDVVLGPSLPYGHTGTWPVHTTPPLPSPPGLLSPSLAPRLLPSQPTPFRRSAGCSGVGAVPAIRPHGHMAAARHPSLPFPLPLPISPPNLPHAGDPLDAVVLGPALPYGHTGTWQVHAMLRFIDGGPLASERADAAHFPSLSRPTPAGNPLSSLQASSPDLPQASPPIISSQESETPALQSSAADSSVSPSSSFRSSSSSSSSSPNPSFLPEAVIAAAASTASSLLPSSPLAHPHPQSKYPRSEPPPSSILPLSPAQPHHKSHSVAGSSTTVPHPTALFSTSAPQRTSLGGDESAAKHIALSAAAGRGGKDRRENREGSGSEEAVLLQVVRERARRKGLAKLFPVEGEEGLLNKISRVGREVERCAVGKFEGLIGAAKGTKGTEGDQGERREEDKDSGGQEEEEALRVLERPLQVQPLQPLKALQVLRAVRSGSRASRSVPSDAQHSASVPAAAAAADDDMVSVELSLRQYLLLTAFFRTYSVFKSVINAVRGIKGQTYFDGWEVAR
ncbi:unnamed protein product [Closterium sp. Naga37s-1]|nr:unnamed protein product [Closterium sp. Naga37s-1]